mgnify:CR=1 FL=1
MGKVIGRQGRIAKAIRTVVKAASSKSRQKSDCRYSAMKKRQELWIPWLLFYSEREQKWKIY